jgi:polar amino acid transport system substrate-binding protein
MVRRKSAALLTVSLSLMLDKIMEVFGRKADNGNFGPDHLTRRYPPQVSEELKTIQGACVLVVEDNEINQQVASELLEQAGMVVTVAENGQKGVEAVQAFAYDLLFMYMQMPVMDGYTATKEIRNWEETLPDVCARVRPRLPIVAMTAHAMVGEKEKCLAVGMDDYLSKPIDQDKLYNMLLRRIKPGNRDTSSIPEKPVCHDDDVSLPRELPGIDLADGLKRVGGNRKLYVKLLTEFVNKYEAVAEEMEYFIKSGDFPEAKRLAHTVKGTAGNLSIGDVQSAVRDLEAAIIGKGIADYNVCLSRLAQEMQIIANLVKTITHPQKERPATPFVCADPAQVAPGLSQLARLLAQSNADAEIYFATIKESIDSSKFSREVEELATRIADFDYASALVSLQNIANAMNISLEE